MPNENITLKMIAKEFGIQTPSLCNHKKSLDDLKKNLMIYGWKQMNNGAFLVILFR